MKICSKCGVEKELSGFSKDKNNKDGRRGHCKVCCNLYNKKYRFENKDKESNAGAKPYSPLLMFKISILQRYYNLSDNQIEYQILDRLSFGRFLGLTLNDRVPDEKTVWEFKERMTKLDLEKELFAVFHSKLEENGLIIHEGKIIDASFVEMPRQRNNREENKHIKETGTAPGNWDGKPNKKRQK